MSQGSLSLTVNGERKVLDGRQTIASLVLALEIEGVRIAVARNGQVIARQEHETTELEEGDSIEIVRMVGGG